MLGTWRPMLVLALMGPLLSAAPGEALADFSFNSQRSLLLPDPFIKRKKEVRKSAAQLALAAPSRRDAHADWGKLDPRLLKLVGAIETQFGGKALISSGCRTKAHNIAVGGAPHSYHLDCMAADISIAGVAPEAIRDYALSLAGRGGVGTYCATPIVHVDVGPPRQWHWGCGRIGSRRDPFALP